MQRHTWPPVQCVNSGTMCKLAYESEAVAAGRRLQYGAECTVVDAGLVPAVAILHVKPHAYGNSNRGWQDMVVGVHKTNWHAHCVCVACKCCHHIARLPEDVHDLWKTRQTLCMLSVQESANPITGGQGHCAPLHMSTPVLCLCRNPGAAADGRTPPRAGHHPWLLPAPPADEVQPELPHAGLQHDPLHVVNPRCCRATLTLSQSSCSSLMPPPNLTKRRCGPVMPSGLFFSCG